MENFEKQAAARLRNHPSPVDTDRLWAGIEAELRPKKRRPLLIWWFAASGAGAVLAGLFFMFSGKTAPAKPAAPALPQPVAATSGTPAPLAAQAPTPGQQTQPKTQPQATAPQPANASPKTANTLIFSTKARPTPSLPPSESTAPQPVFSEKTAAAQPKFWADFAQLPMPGGAPVASENTPSIQPGHVAPPEGKCYSFNGGGLRLRPYLSVYGGGHLPMRKLEAKDPEFEAAAAQRGQTETVLEAVSAGGALGLHLTRNIFVEAGAEWQRVTERFDWSRTTRDTLGKFVTVGFLINAPGDTTFYTDSVDIVRTTTLRKQTFNRYTFVNVPLAVGYAWQPKARLGLFARAGISLNVAFRQRGELLDNQGEPQRFDSQAAAPGHPFRPKIGLAPFAAAGLRYGLGPRLDLFGEARYQQHLTDVTTYAHPIRQRYSLLGLQVGAKWRL